MCGLFGYIGTSPDNSIMRQVVLEASRRGVHSWGIFTMSKDGKTGKEIRQGIPDAKTLEAIDFSGYTHVVGHCRLATSGSYKIDDGQPLENEDQSRVIAHNGTVREYCDIVQELNYKMLTQNDSESILAILQRGSMGDVISMLGDRHYALIYFDVLGKMMHVARVYHPLYLYSSDTGIYICSRKVTDEFIPVPERKVITGRL